MEKTNGRILTLFGGSFKPPTAGHFNIVKWASDTLNPNEEFKLFVGAGKRGSVSQTTSISIWKIYKKYLNPKVIIVPTNSPIRDIIEVAKKNPNDRINMVIGYRLGNQKDLLDLDIRTRDLPSNITVLVHTSRDIDSGTKARAAFKISKEHLRKYLPEQLSTEDVTKIFNLLNNNIREKLNTTTWT